jgi:hypothetical protein
VYLRNTFWTAGLDLEKCRVSLAKLQAKGYRLFAAVDLKMNGPDYKQERGRESCRSATGTRWRRHGRTRQKLAGVRCCGDSEHHSTNGKHREEVQSTASSPRSKSGPRMVLERRAARDGGWLGLCGVSGSYGVRTDAAREHDGAEGLGARLI